MDAKLFWVGTYKIKQSSQLQSSNSSNAKFFSTNWAIERFWAIDNVLNPTLVSFFHFLHTFSIWQSYVVRLTSRHQPLSGTAVLAMMAWSNALGSASPLRSCALSWKSDIDLDSEGHCFSHGNGERARKGNWFLRTNVVDIMWNNSF